MRSNIIVVAYSKLRVPT